jgi:hypothetical protein
MDGWVDGWMARLLYLVIMKVLEFPKTFFPFQVDLQLELRNGNNNNNDDNNGDDEDCTWAQSGNCMSHST